MGETKQIRLMAAAKEFNVGLQTIVDFLGSKKMDIKNSPMEKLSPEMYSALSSEYATDKKAKENSEKVELSIKSKPKETVVVKVAEVVEAPIVKEVVEAAPEPIAKAEPVAEIAEEQPVKPTKAKSKTTESKDNDADATDKKSDDVSDADLKKVEKTVLDGPKVIARINLDEVGKPKKGAKKAEPKVEEAPRVAATKKTAPKTEKPIEKPIEKPVAILEPKVVEPPKEIVIENVVERKVLDGLKVLGKIVLPVANSNDANARGNRKRKRIPLGGKEAPKGAGGSPSTGGNNRPGTPGGDRRNGPGGSPNRRPNTPRTAEEKIIDENAIQEKIKETLAKLGGGGNKSRNQKGSKYRRDKRENYHKEQEAAERSIDDTILKVTEFISVNELATLMNVSFAEVIGKCMNLGMMVSINQRLDAEVIELVSSEFGYKVEFINLEQEADNDVDEEIDDPASLETRPPIITIMGHVDHGKTSLLDYIRNTNVIAGESGGITQHIGAYEVTLPNGKQITFLDTPGHEAFTAMRARGAKVTDLAVIVIAADDAVMPQTKEAISHAQAAGVPMIFAINKMDRDGANPQKIYEQLSAMNILVEEWGGKFQSQPIAAKVGLNIDLLLEKILLESELLDVKANANRDAVGSIIESNLDKGRGYVATILVQNGTLKIGDMIVAGSVYGRVKAMTNERGGKVKEAGPSTPVQILGLNGAPQAGEKFKVYADEDAAKEVATHRAQIMREQGIRTKKHITIEEIGRRLALGNFKQLNVIIKGDVDGSVEALSDSLQKLSTPEIAVSVVHKAVGSISESDVMLATASDAIILGFQVRANAQVTNLADKENIEIKYYSVIYDAIDEIRNAMEGLLEPKIEQKRIANIEVREVFKITGVGTIAGCMVLDGKMNRNNKINLIRDGIVIYTGELTSLKRFKDDAKEVISGMECGIGIKNYNDLKNGDIIEAFEEIETKRTL
jgi:translation initiation factor IF-2